MAFRFQKRIKMLPGVTLNFSRRGVSTSIGTTGARVTLGHGQTRTTVGLPGTGISQTSVSKSAAAQQTEQMAEQPTPVTVPARPAKQHPVARALGRLVGRLLRR